MDYEYVALFALVVIGALILMLDFIIRGDTQVADTTCRSRVMVMGPVSPGDWAITVRVEVMKILTVITTLFMPLSFVVGFFGMNFFQPVAPLDAWTDRLAFWLTLTGMLLTPVGM